MKNLDHSLMYERNKVELSSCLKTRWKKQNNRKKIKPNTHFFSQKYPSHWIEGTMATISQGQDVSIKDDITINHWSETIIIMHLLTKPFFFSPGNKIRYRNVHLRHSFWPKSLDLYSNKDVSVCISPRATSDPSRAWWLFPVLFTLLHTALIQGFSR